MFGDFRDARTRSPDQAEPTRLTLPELGIKEGRRELLQATSAAWRRAATRKGGS